jgi:dihydroneopterin aldolase
MIVGLHNIRMRGYHGIYEHEKINGNDFIINVEVGFESDDQIVDLHQTINYETVLNIV